MSHSQVLYPEILCCVGAGAMQSLGIPTTAQQEEAMIALCGLKNRGSSLEERIADSRIVADDAAASGRLRDFLVVLGDNLDRTFEFVGDDALEAARNLYPDSGDTSDEELCATITHLRRTYDWNALRRVAMVCPCDETTDENANASASATNGEFLRMLFSLLDSKIDSGFGLKVKKIEKEEVAGCGENDDETPKCDLIPSERLVSARNCLTMLISTMLACAWDRACKDQADKADQYLRFAMAYEQFVREEGRAIVGHDEGHWPCSSPKFYLSSCAFASWNFDGLLYWAMLCAREEHKREQPKQTMQIKCVDYPTNHFYELGKGFLISNIHDDEEDEKERPNKGVVFDASAITRMNAENRLSTGKNKKLFVSRLSKFYFVHGACFWRECPSCGKLTITSGKTTNFLSGSIFKASPANICDYSEGHGQIFHDDQVRCLYCGQKTEAADSPMVMQTMSKSSPTSFLEEIQREAKANLANARHIILFGYSLPEDDIAWRNAFSEAVKSHDSDEDPVYCSIVNYVENGPEWWLSPEELQEWVAQWEEEHTNEGVTKLVRSVWRIFKRNRVRAYLGGIPQVFGKNAQADLRELLYGSGFVNWDRTRLEGFAD